MAEILSTEVEHDRPKQPEDSDVEIETAADGITLHVPPAGLWRGSKGLTIFGLLWCGFIGIITVAMLIPLFEGETGLWALLALLLCVFWPIGIGLLLGGINMGRRRAVLAVVGDQLMVLQTGIFGGKRQQWSRKEIAQIRTGPSGFEVNDTPVMELQIQPHHGKTFGLLAGRKRSELDWLAAMLWYELR